MARHDEREVTRRGFLGTAIGGLAASSLAQPFSALAQVPDIKLPEIPGKKAGWAIVGLGNLAINQILPAFAKCDRSKVVALVSGRPPKAQHLAKVYGVDAAKGIYNYDNFDTMMSNPAIDVVYIVLPNSMHAEYTVRALKAGKHVLCEKPMANTVAECEQMIAAAKAASRKLMIGYRLRYEPYTQALIKIARDNAELGETRLILADAGFNAGDPKQWRLKKAMAGGGPLMDMGVYSIQATRYLTGEEPVEVNAMTYTTPNDPRFSEVEESVTFQFRFPSGILANCSTSYGAPMNRYRVCKQRGWADMEPAQYYSGLRLHVFKNGVMEDRPQRTVDHFQAEMDHFSECILNGTNPLTPGEDGLQDLKLVTAIYESARNDRPVKLG